MTAARDGKPVDSHIEMASSEGLNTSDPDYAPPCVGDIQLVYIAWDILFVGEEVRQPSILQWMQWQCSAVITQGALCVRLV